jgi:hypothetical protein
VRLGAFRFGASLTENPWDQFDRIVVSRDFLCTDRAREAFDAAEKDADLAVIDEAHGHTISVGGKGYINKKSARYMVAETVSRRSHRLILVTATPHSGARLQPLGLASSLGAGCMGAIGVRAPGARESRLSRGHAVAALGRRDAAEVVGQIHGHGGLRSSSARSPKRSCGRERQAALSRTVILNASSSGTSRT